METYVGQVMVSLKYYPNKGAFPVKIYVRYLGVARIYTIKQKISKKKFEAFMQGKENCPNLRMAYDQAVDAVRFLVEKDAFTFDRFVSLMKRGSVHTIQDLAQRKIFDLQDAGKHRTAKTYEDLLSSLERFSSTPIPISSFNPDMVKSYVAFLTKIGNNNSTIGMRLRNLRHLFNLAVEDFVIKRNPMDGFKIPSSSKRKLDISENTLKKLLTLKKEETTERRYMYLSLWRLQYYCNGMNVIDLLHLKKTNIVQDEIIFKRHKTEGRFDTPITIPITEPLKEVLAVFKPGRRYLLDFLDRCEPNSKEEMVMVNNITRQMNLALKNICKDFGLEDNVTSYTARHAFATRLLRNGVPVEFISMALGHSSISTTQHYLEGYTAEQRLKAAQMLKIED